MPLNDTAPSPYTSRLTMLQMCRTFIPLLSKTGRIVNLSSVASSLKPYNESIQQRFRNPEATLEDLDKLTEEYLVSLAPF